MWTNICIIRAALQPNRCIFSCSACFSVDDSSLPLLDCSFVCDTPYMLLPKGDSCCWANLFLLLQSCHAGHVKDNSNYHHLIMI
mmetsp:Transcript_118497/g.206283  ORF Transcript_118497/g.206283 Transcript_118497/m.206283 type:complete len:84 (+) Transcript_118497:71-322(+)